MSVGKSWNSLDQEMIDLSRISNAFTVISLVCCYMPAASQKSRDQESRASISNKSPNLSLNLFGTDASDA